MARIEFEGNLGSAPELRHTQSGSAVLGFRVADSKSRKTESGDWEKLAEQWLNVSVWGSLGELLEQKLDKGTRVRVIGEFYIREYDKQDGSRGYSLDVKAWGVDVLSKPRQVSAPANGSWTADGAAGGGWGNSAAPAPTDDVPF